VISIAFSNDLHRSSRLRVQEYPQEFQLHNANANAAEHLKLKCLNNSSRTQPSHVYSDAFSVAMHHVMKKSIIHHVSAVIKRKNGMACHKNASL
jgi:hypothetical protein